MKNSSKEFLQEIFLGKLRERNILTHDIHMSMLRNMEKKKIKNELRQYGNFLSISQLAQFMGCDRKTVKKEYLSGLDYIPNGRAKLYFIDDIADALLAKARKENFD